MVNGNHYAANNTDAVAKAIKGGTNMELGDRFFTTGYLQDAVSSGMLTLGDVAASVRTVMRARFQTGQFDPINATAYTSLGMDDIASPSHQKVNFDAAVQSLVLLRNSGQNLPYKTGTRVGLHASMLGRGRRRAPSSVIFLHPAAMAPQSVLASRISFSAPSFSQTPFCLPPRLPSWGRTAFRRRVCSAITPATSNAPTALTAAFRPLVR